MYISNNSLCGAHRAPPAAPDEYESEYDDSPKVFHRRWSKAAQHPSPSGGPFWTKTAVNLDSSFSSVDDNKSLDEEALMVEHLPSGHRRRPGGRHRRSHNMDFTTVLPQLSASALELPQHPLKR